MDYSNINTDSFRSADLGGQISDLAGKSNADVSKQYTSGNSEARGLLNSGDNLDRSLNFKDQAMGDAIKRKYSQQYGRTESEIDNKMLQNASSDHIRQLQSASDLAGQEVEQNRQKEILRWKMQQAKKSQRGAILGHVLGIAGGIAGGVVAGVGTLGIGAAGGAMAGMAAGEAAGNAIGSAN